MNFKYISDDVKLKLRLVFFFFRLAIFSAKRFVQAGIMLDKILCLMGNVLNSALQDITQKALHARNAQRLMIAQEVFN